MKHRIYFLAVLVVGTMPMASHGDDFVFRGIVMHSQFDPYVVAGSVNSDGSATQGYCLLYDAAGNYFLAIVNSSAPGANGPAAGNASSSTAAPNRIPTQIIGEGNQRPTTGSVPSAQLTGPPANSTRPASQPPAPPATGSPQGHNSAARSAGSIGGAAAANAGNQVSTLNLAGTIIASNEAAAVNSAIQLNLNVTSGAINVTTTQGVELTGQGVVLTRPSALGNTSTTRPPGAVRQR